MAEKGVPSEDFLLSLHQNLGEAMRNPELGLEFARITRTLREQRFARGKTDVKEIEVDGRLRFRVNVGDRLGADVYFGSYREMVDIEALCRVLSPGDTVVDAGANFGFVSVMAADRISQHGRVIAFEPDGAARALLADNIKLNRFSRRITVVPRCLSNEDAMVRFHSMQESAFSGMADNGRAKSKEVVMVPAQRLDSAAKELKLKRIDVLKIDVEGFEYAVLEGGLGILGKSPDPLVMFEVSSKNLDEKRREYLNKVLGGLVSDDWEMWAYAIERNELARVASTEELLGGGIGNAFLARKDSARLGKLRDAYEAIVSSRLLPAALQRYLGSAGGQEASKESPHALQRLLWNSFTTELTSRLHEGQAKARAEAQRYLAQLESSSAALQHERAQRELASQRGEQGAAEIARLQTRVAHAEQARDQLQADLHSLRADLAAEQGRTAAMAHDIKELNIIINQRDSARMAAEERLGAESVRAREAGAALAEQRQALDAERVRIRTMEEEIRAFQQRLFEAELLRKLAEERLAAESARSGETSAGAEKLREAAEAEKKRVFDLELKVRDLQEIIKQRDAARMLAEERLATEFGRIKALEANGEDQRAKLVALAQANEALSVDRAALEQKLKQTLAAGAEEAARLAQEGDRLNQLLAATDRRLEELTADASRNDTTIRTLNDTLSARDARVASLEQELIATRKSLRESEGQLRQLRAALEQSDQAIGKLDERMAAETGRAREAARAAADAIADLQRRIEAERQKSGELESKLRDLRIIIAERDAARAGVEEKLAAEVKRGKEIAQRASESLAEWRNRSAEEGRRLAATEEKLRGAEQMAAQFAKARAELEDLHRATAAKHREEVRQAAEVAAAQQKKILAERQRAEGLDALVRQLQAALEQQKTEAARSAASHAESLEERRKQAESLEARIRDLESAHAEQARGVLELGERMQQDAERAREALRGEAEVAATAQQRAAELEHELSELHVIMKQRELEWHRSGKRLAQEIAQLTAELKTTQMELADLRLEMQQVKESRANLEREFEATLQRRIQRWLKREPASSGRS